MILRALMKIDKGKILVGIGLISAIASSFGIMFLLNELYDALNIKSVHWYDEVYYDDEGDIVENASTTVWYAGFYIAIITSIRVYVMVVEKTIILNKLSTGHHKDIKGQYYYINWESLYWNLVIGFVIYGIIGYFLDEYIFGYEEGYHQILGQIVNMGLFVYICYLGYSKSKIETDKKSNFL